MMGKLKKNRKKFYNKQGQLRATQPTTSPSTPSTAHQPKPSLLTSQRNRQKWRRVFKHITKVMHAVSIIQDEMKKKKIKGEVEPSEMLLVVSELSRRACYSTDRDAAGNVVGGSKRVERPGHMDHAPTLLKDGGRTVPVPSAVSTSNGHKFFAFSTDVLGYTFSHVVLPVLSKRTEDRTPSDLHAVAHLLRGLHFFNMFEDDVLVALLSNSLLHAMQPGDVLYKRGDPPEMVYVVLTGKLSVIVRHLGLNFTACDLFSGTSVGEEAVASGNVQKNTVMATETTLLLALPRYPLLLTRLKRDMIEAKVTFLQSVSILSTTTSDIDLRKLATHLTVVRVKDNTVVCKEGTPVTHLLLVKSGHLRTVKIVKHPKQSGVGKSSGRSLLVEVQQLHGTDFFGENSFRHMPINMIRSMRGAKKKQRQRTSALGEGKTQQHYGQYMASLISQTYCEIYEIPISTVHAIVSKSTIESLTSYGRAREQLYGSDSLTQDLQRTLQHKKKCVQAMNSVTSL